MEAAYVHRQQKAAATAGDPIASENETSTRPAVKQPSSGRKRRRLTIIAVIIAGSGAAGRPAADDHRPYAADGLFCPPGGHAGRNDHVPLGIARLVLVGFRFRHRDSRRPKRNGPGGRQPHLRPFALEACSSIPRTSARCGSRSRGSALKLTRDGSNVEAVFARWLTGPGSSSSQGVDLSRRSRRRRGDDRRSRDAAELAHHRSAGCRGQSRRLGVRQLRRARTGGAGRVAPSMPHADQRHNRLSRRFGTPATVDRRRNRQHGLAACRPAQRHGANPTDRSTDRLQGRKRRRAVGRRRAVRPVVPGAAGALRRAVQLPDCRQYAEDRAVRT